MKAAIYVRQSEDKTGQGLAVGRQLTECRDLVQRNGWDLGETYSDNDKSASSSKERPAWTALLAALSAGRYDVLVCWHTDRLYRRLRDLVDLVEIAEQRSLRIAAVKAGDVDLTTPAGRMLAGMLGHAARYEVEQKAVRQKASNLQRAQRGVMLWTRRPFGFQRDGQRVTVDRNEAREIRRAAKAVLQGATLTEVARGLNERGVPTTLGNEWTIRTIKQVLVNPRVAGRIVYNGQDMGPAPWKPILDAETYDRLTATLSDPRRRTAQTTTLRHFLSGICICDACDQVMYATVSKSKYTAKYHVYRCLSCKRTRKLEHVDEVVEEVLLARLKRPDVAELLVPDVDVVGLQKHADELRTRRDGLAALLAEGLLSRDAVRVQASKLGERITNAERQIADALGTSPVADLANAEDVTTAWEAMGLLARREVVRTLLEVRILAAGKGSRFDPRSVQIVWKGRN